MRPSSKRTGPGREPDPELEPGTSAGRPAAAASGGARVRMCGHGFPLIALENSKYPKGTPFVPIFLYLNTSNFYPMANVGLNALATFSPILALN